MNKKHKIMLGVILFVLALVYVAVGVFLFNICADTYTKGYDNMKDAMVMSGSFFSFVIGFGCLVGSVIFLIYGFVEE